MIVEDFLRKIQYTEEDLQDFQSIGSVIIKDKKILMMDHVKFNFWTVPIGKVKKDETVEEGLKVEVKEELNIDITKFKLLTIWKKIYNWRGQRIKTENFLYLIEKFRGSIKNNEPKKHRSIKYMSIDEIKKVRISDMTKQLLKVYEKGQLKI
jgi:ADP-ribose pyrophosphatase YjhB (NUDIX family)